MKTYKQLEKEFGDKIAALQKVCPHKKSYWADHWWALGHSSGYKVKVCERCRKILEEKPTRKEREEAEMKRREILIKGKKATVNVPDSLLEKTKRRKKVKRWVL